MRGLVPWLLLPACFLPACFLPACFLLEPRDGFLDAYRRHSFDDLFVVAESVLDRGGRIEVADRQAGRIRSAWSPAVPERGGRLLRRRRALLTLIQRPGEVELEIRFETQVRRTDLSSSDWLSAGDDNAEAARLSREIRVVLEGNRPEEPLP